MMGANSSAGVAIVGIACRFPGAADHSAFWRNLCEGVESISTLSDDDLVSAGVPAELLRDPSYVKAAALLPDIDQFDAAFFEYSPQQARLMDPQQRLLLEVAWEAFEDAGQPVGSVPGPRSLHGRRRSREQLSRRTTALERGPTSRSRARRNPRYPRRSHDCFIGRSPQN
jgi:acyl transferase domain-containing protein